MSASKRVLAIFLLGVLVMAVAIPAGAVALPRRNRALSSLNATASAYSVASTISVTATKRGTALKARIAAVLERRKARFDTAHGRLATRLAKVRHLADVVAAAGGDVAASSALLDSAAAHLDAASALEAKCVAAFEAIPTASDRRAAFAAARAIGREAAGELRLARKDLRAAVVDLRSVVRVLKDAANASGGTS